jgi:hypothetical protein
MIAYHWISGTAFWILALITLATLVSIKISPSDDSKKMYYFSYGFTLALWVALALGSFYFIIAASCG